MGFVISQPKLIEFFKHKFIKQVALGEAHTLVLDQMGQVYSFGWGDLG